MRRTDGQSPAHRGRRALCLLLALTAGTFGMLSARATSAGAAPTESGLRAQAAALASRLNSLTQQEARADEQFNQAQTALAAAQARQAAAQQAADRAAADVARKRAVLKTAAVSAYMSGGQVPAMQALLQSSASSFGIQQGYLQSVVDTQQSAVDALREAEGRLAVQQAHLAQATAAAHGDVTRAASLRSQLNSTAAAESSALSQTRGQLAQLVAADQAAAAARAAAAAKARILAEAAAAAARQAASSVSRDNPLPSPVGGSGSGGSGSGPGSLGPPPTGSGSASGAATQALQYAESVLGDPYVYGAAGPSSFDCSGLVMWAFGRAGISLPHSAAGQWDDTTRIPYSELRPGDLVFFYQPVDHVGIYVGNGEMIDAPHTGASVEYDSIWWSGLDGFGRVG